MDSNMKKNIAILKTALEASNVIDWKITASSITRANVYVTKDHKIEDTLESERADVSMTVYTRVGDKVGESTLPIKSFKKADIDRQIKEGITICKHSLNKGYHLAPKAVSYPSVTIADSKMVSASKRGKLDEVCLNLVKRMLKEFKNYKKVRLSSMELHTSIHNALIINSKGVKAEALGTRVHMENIITAFDKDEEQEFFNMATYRRLSDIKVKELVKKYTTAARHVLESTKPKKFSGKILLSSDAIHEFFTPELSASPFFMHAFAKIKHMSMSKYELDKAIIPRFNCDKLTIHNNPLLNYNIGAMPFDDDGVRARKLLVIKDGVFKNYIASKRYADYMGVEPTGPIGVFEMKHGSKSKIELYKSKEAMYEIVSFSSFVPNWVSGDFAAEVRLGYVIKNGKKKPFKGGMFVGNIFDMIKDMWLSKEVVKQPGYHGPEVARFEFGTVSGD